jgi:hypothetical protein
MPEGVGYGPQDTASAGLNLNVIGNHGYAYSGVIADASSAAADSLMLKFTSGNFNFVGHLNFTDDHVANDNIYLTMSLNGTIVINVIYRSAAAGTDNLNPWDIMIPPYTDVEIKFGASSNVDGTAWLTGKIYGKVD